jgi:hypothetical protein
MNQIGAQKLDHIIDGTNHFDLGFDGAFLTAPHVIVMFSNKEDASRELYLQIHATLADKTIEKPPFL